MLDWRQCRAIERSAEVLSGAWAFAGTRVPVTALFVNLQSGATVDEFLAWFPGVGRDQIAVVFAHIRTSLQVSELTQFDEEQDLL